ncbi:lysylphosphatidylglycerol synthase transmembrane domain-containing protein [Hymenobacter polaris]|nr:lysylphosphatidylglycerol synthase transmembrane domain-containing protein [Hymenobacter polaris]
MPMPSPPPPAPPDVQAAESDLLRQLRPSRLIWPVLIGLGVVGFLFWRSYTPGSLAPLADAKWEWLLITLLVLWARDLGYIYRIRHIAECELSWGQAFGVIAIWEFASCVLPSAAGGTAVAPVILTKEGIPLGKSLAYTIVTALLDNLYYVLMVPLVVVLARKELYPRELDSAFVETLRVLFIVSYLAVSAYAGLLLYALFVNPFAVRRLLVRVSSIRALRRFRRTAYRHGQEMVNASVQLRGAGWLYWWRASISTVFVWTARYAVIGCLIAAFVPAMTSHEFRFIFARNLTYKVLLLIAVTPGGSGIAEGAFPTFFGRFIGTAAMTSFIVLLYRIVTYYFYLLVGLLYLPRWAGRRR